MLQSLKIHTGIYFFRQLKAFFNQEGHEALNRSPEYTGQSQTFNFEIWMTFGQGQRMTLTFDTHSTSLNHLGECKKITFSNTKAYVTKFDLDVK